MSEFMLKLLGARAEDVVRIADASLAFRGGLAVGWTILAILLAGALTIWMYRKSPAMLSPWRMYTLMSLRFLFLSLLLLLLMRPILSLTVEGSVRRMLIVLTDGTASLNIEDPRVTMDDKKRAAIARGSLDPTKALSQDLSASDTAGQGKIARVELVKSALKNKDLNLLPRLSEEFDLAAYSFGKGLQELSSRRNTTSTNDEPDSVTIDQFTWIDSLKAESPVTAMGDAIREVINRKRGQPLAGIFLLTDGANNSGSQPGEIAALCRQEALPLYIYGVGITAPRDIIMGNLFAPDVSFVRDEVPVTVRLRGQGLIGEQAELQLKIGQEVVASQTVTFESDGEMVIPLSFTPQEEGEFELTASIEPRPDETVSSNNARTQRLRVIDSKIKVLLADQSPRWEFRYLQAMLLRDRRVDLNCWLVESDPRMARAEDTPFLENFPARKEELFEYDLIFYGDIDPKAVSVTQLENISELVSRFGGAFIQIAGKQFAPHTYRRGILEKLLPVEYSSPTLRSSGEVIAERPIQLELTPAGSLSPMLRLSENATENAALWAKLPPIYWVARVARPKPAAEVLLVDPDPAKESRFGKMPVIAVQQYGLGQVMFVGTDNTWRWRKNVGDAYYTTLWGQIAQRVSLQRLLGVSKRTQLTTDRQNYLTGDRVTIFARLYAAGYEPMQEPSVTGIYGLKEGQGPRPEVVLRPIPEQPGLYRGEFIAPTAGHYQFFVEHDLDTPLDFSVSEPRFEFGETAMNETLLREMSKTSGGEFFREESLHALPETIRNRTERVQSPLEVELWASPFYFILLLFIVTIEWVMRKLCHLK